MKSKKNLLLALTGIVVALIIATTILLMQVLSIKNELKPQMSTIAEEQESTAETEKIQIYLPETYYAATGLTMGNL